MIQKRFEGINTYAISLTDIPALLLIAERLAESRKIWFITELSIRNANDDLFPDESILKVIADSVVSHRHILLIVDDEARNKSLYNDISFSWQQFNGIVLHVTEVGKRELLQKILKQHSFSATERSLCFVPTISMMDVQTDLPALGYMGSIQKLMLSDNSDVADFFDINLDVLKTNPAIVVYKQEEQL